MTTPRARSPGSGATCASRSGLLQRAPEQRDGGLSTAVVAGMRLARAPWALVMDADLQHPPEVVPQLFRTARRQQGDLAAASRAGRVAGGRPPACSPAVTRATAAPADSTGARGRAPRASPPGSPSWPS